MATLSRGQTFGASETVTNTKLHNLVDLGAIANIANADISPSAAIADTKLADITTGGKVRGSALSNLASIPAGAGGIPAGNISTVYGTSLLNLASIPSNAGSIPAINISTVYPVGCIYISTVSTNPATVFGFGTWVSFAAGRVLVGIDSGQSEFDTVEETGGSKTHTLTTDEMPAHTHTISTRNSNGYGTTVQNSDAQNQSETPSTGSTGGGAAHNNLQPYIVVYMFKRTA